MHWWACVRVTLCLNRVFEFYALASGGSPGTVGGERRCRSPSDDFTDCPIPIRITALPYTVRLNCYEDGREANPARAV